METFLCRQLDQLGRGSGGEPPLQKNQSLRFADLQEGKQIPFVILSSQPASSGALQRTYSNGVHPEVTETIH